VVAVVGLLDVAWDQAGRVEVELLVGWMRSAAEHSAEESHRYL
jgi:hypothetical protein